MTTLIEALREVMGWLGPPAVLLGIWKVARVVARFEADFAVHKEAMANHAKAMGEHARQAVALDKRVSRLEDRAAHSCCVDTERLIPITVAANGGAE